MPRRIPFWFLDTAILSVLTLLLHLPLLQLPALALNSDYAFISLDGYDFIRHGWYPFYNGQNYGGSWFSLLQGLFFLWAPDWSSAVVRFNYVFCPVLITLLNYGLVLRLFSRVIAWLTSLIVAVGLFYFYKQFGNDFYMGYLILGLILLIIRGKCIHPLEQLSTKMIFLSGILSGLAFYTQRSSAVLILAAWIPAVGIGAARERLRPETWTERVLVRGVCIFLGLFGFIYFFGDVLGNWSGRPVKLLADPNIKYALILATVYSFIRFRRELLNPKYRQRLLLALVGFGIGFAPELYVKCVSSATTSVNLNSHDFKATVETLGALPSVLIDLWTASPDLTRVFSLLLLSFGIPLLIIHARSKPHLRPAVLILVLGVFLFSRYSTGAIGVSRYLFQIMPALLIVQAVIVGELLSGRASKRILVGIILLGHVFHHGLGRQAWIANAHSSAEPRRAVSAFFGRQDLNLVICEDYWDCHAHSLMTSGTPLFWRPDALAPRVVQKRIEQATVDPPARIGLLLHSALAAPFRRNIFGREYRFDELSRAGNDYVSIGVKLGP